MTPINLLILMSSLTSTFLAAYMLYDSHIKLKRQKERSKQVNKLCEEIERLCKRNSELIYFALELRMRGDHYGANLIDEDIANNIAKIDALEIKLNKICS